MKIRPYKLQKGNNLWYRNITYFDPTKYNWEYNTKAGLKKGDVRGGFKSPWASPNAGLDPGRYTPTDLSPEYGTMGVEKSHFNYTKEVEGHPYYSEFTKALFDKDNKVTPVGMEYIRQSDDLLPQGHNARILNPDGTIKDSITVKLRDAHNRAPQIKTFNLKNPEELKAYIEHVRTDQTVGGRHNVFPKVGKRYFYYDDEGKTHWVNPEEAQNYEMFDTPDEGYDNNGVYWYDYQLKGPKDPNNPTNPNQKGQTAAEHHDGRYGIDLSKIKINPADVLGLGRLFGNLWNNNRVYNETLKGIRPNLQQTYRTHRQVYGDEASKQYMYGQAAQGESQASRAFTSDSVRQMAQQMEAKRIGDDLRTKGNLADNEMVKRTSDESNQHEWANTQRATELANYNLTETNKANAERHNLKAQKWSADWTSVDNALKEIQYRAMQRQAKKDAINDQIWTLQTQQDLAENQKLIDANNKLREALRNNDNDLNAKEVIDAKKERDRIYNNLMIEYYRLRPISAEKGTKITYKSKDDLLYKTARDAVAHFREMSKLSARALAQAKPKPVKLSSHPRKMQQGGVAPFTVYTPIALGGEQGASYGVGTTSSNSGSTKKKGDDTLDLIKELFKQVQGSGLPVDVNMLYKQFQGILNYHQAFGNELSTEDISSMYLQAMNQLNNIKYSKNEYDKAKTHAETNDAINEYVVTPSGKYIVQNKNGLSEASLSEIINNKLTPITNEELLYLRAYSPQLLGQRGDDFVKFINNGVGMSKIAAHIKSILPSIKNNEIKEDSFVSNKLRAGIQALQNAPEGDYKVTITDKNQKEQAKYALEYIIRMLPKNMKATLNINAAEQGIDPTSLLSKLIGSETGITRHVEYDPITGKGAKKDGEGNDKIKTNPLVAMQREIGGSPKRYELVTRDSNTKTAVNGTNYSSLPKVKSDMSVDQMLSVSGIDGILQGDKRGITFGDQEINPENLRDIMYANNGTNIIVTLPCKIVNGQKVVNLGVREAYERAEEKALKVNNNRQSPEFLKALGEELHKEKLDSLLDSNGYPNKNMFAQFLVVEAYTTDKVNFDKNSQYIEKVSNPDSSLEQRMKTALSTDNKKSNYDVDIKDHWFEWWGYDDIYRGTMFIPLNNNINAALNSLGSQTLTMEQQQDLEELYQISNKAANYNNNNSYEAE